MPSPHQNPEGEGTGWAVEVPLEEPYEGRDSLSLLTIQPSRADAIARGRWVAENQADRSVAGEITATEHDVDEALEQGEIAALPGALEETVEYLREQGHDLTMNDIKTLIEQHNESVADDPSRSVE